MSEKLELVDWASIIHNYTPAIVELQVNYVRTFGGSRAHCGVGTGFVVDKQRGFILTNRHIVSLGPITATAVFTNKKRINVIPVYRDPVHDFGIFKYDPTEIDYPELTEIKLAPEEAKVGVEFRIIGSGESEQNSIIPGTLASTSRRAPKYENYWDFNTFYFAAVSNAKPGTSGSPLLGPSGSAIALNAGGSKRGAASFFLPLDRVVYALDCLQAEKPVLRGTVLAIFKHETFDEVVAKGLKRDVESTVRKVFKEATGLLVCKEVVPDGPADQAGLKPGDVLLKVNEQYLHQFLPLQIALDDVTRGDILLEISRNGEIFTLKTEIIDLHACYPDEFLEVGDAVLHSYSFPVGVGRNIPLNDGVMICDPGYMLGHAYVPGGGIITEINGVRVKNLDETEEVFKALEDKAKVIIKFFLSKRDEMSKVVTIDKKWFPMRRGKKNDITGRWDYRTIETKEIVTTPTNVGTELSDDDLRSVYGADLFQSLVLLEIRAPLCIDGAPFSKTQGVGVVVSLNPGIIVTSRRLIFSHLVDIIASFGSLVEVNAEIGFLHPTQNIAVLRFDSTALLGKGVRVHPAEVNDTEADRLLVGDKLSFYGITLKEEQVKQECSISGIETPYFGEPRRPSFISRNEHFFLTDHKSSLKRSVGGVFTRKGNKAVKIMAFWFLHFRDNSYKVVSARNIAKAIHRVKQEDLLVRSLAVSLQGLPIGKVRIAANLPDSWVEQFVQNKRPIKAQIYMLRKLMANSEPSKYLRQGDFLLSVNGNVISDLEILDESIGSEEVAEVVVLRDKQVVHLKVETAALSGFTTRRVIYVNGLVVHETFDAVRYSGFIPMASEKGEEEKELKVYLQKVWAGSPATRGKFRPHQWISKVNGKETRGLESFLERVLETKDGEYVNFEMVGNNGAKTVLSLQNDFHNFSPTQFILKDGEWKFQSLL